MIRNQEFEEDFCFHNEISCLVLLWASLLTYLLLERFVTRYFNYMRRDHLKIMANVEKVAQENKLFGQSLKHAGC
jgi:hypothetical protein